MTQVTILGGGVAGLTAAHELAERGVDVTVYERNDRFGGKARSLPGPQLGDGAALPAEHGFRFFPSFYNHLFDTMARTPLSPSAAGDSVAGAETATVAENLVPTTQMLQAVTDGPAQLMVTDRPQSLAEWRERLQSVFGGEHVPADESAYFVERILTLLTSCDQRFDEEYERTPWWEFINAEAMSPGYQKFIAYGLTQSLVAMRPQVSSTRTIGRIYLQMIRGLFEESIHADQLLNGPTNRAWIDPWTDYLEELGVTLETGVTVTEIECDGERVTGVELDRAGKREFVDSADYYIAAVPVEAMIELTTPELEAAAPALAGLERIDTAWMNGLQYYLAEDVPTAHGHGVYYDSPWALTSISQRQFWDGFEDQVDEDVGGILSVIISEWEEPGIVYNKPATACTREELATEVFEQMKAHLNRGETVLADDNLLASFVDPALSYDDKAGRLANREPLLINTVGSRQYRPTATLECPNLLLAADYVRTNTDLASMESANEAGRRAVNAILEREGMASRCELWDFEKLDLFEPARREDELRFRLGLPHPGSASPALWEGYRRVTAGPRTAGKLVTRLLER